MRRLLMVLLCGAGLFAQETVSRVLKMKHISAESTIPILNVLAGKQVRWQADNRMGIVAINGPADVVNALEEAIGKLDVPAPTVKSVELTFHMLLASGAGDSSALPAELAGVGQQLRNVFGMKSIKLLESAVVRGRDGMGGETNGVMASPTKIDVPARYTVRYSGVSVSGEKALSVRVASLQFFATVPYPTGNGYQNSEVGIKTELEIREGQKVVVGKSSIDNASQSIFLVVTAKVVD